MVLGAGLGYAAAGLGIALLALAACTAIFHASGFFAAECRQEGARAATLDSLRGFAALIVYFHHAVIYREWFRTGVWGEAPAPWLLSIGRAAVLVFFMVTGYLFWTKAMGKTGVLPPWRLWAGRLCRLAPLYLAALVPVGLASGLLSPEAPSAFLQALPRLLLLGAVEWNVSAYDLTPLNAGVQWTLWYEWRFYLALPLVAVMATPKRTPVLVALVLGAWWWLRFPPIWLAFLPGILTAWALKHPRAKALVHSRAIHWAVLLWTLVFLYFRRSGDTAWSVLMLAPGFALIAGGCSFGGILTLPGAVLLGHLSYSLYLLHGVFLFCVLTALQNAGLLQSMNEPSYWAAVGTASIPLLLLCAATYRWIERRWYGNRPAVALTSGKEG